MPGIGDTRERCVAERRGGKDSLRETKFLFLGACESMDLHTHISLNFGGSGEAGPVCEGQ